MTKQIRIYLFLFLATLLAGLPAYGQVGSGIITMTTAKNIGEQIRLKITADGDFTIDGVEEQPAEGYNDYTITNQQIVIRGNVTELRCNWRYSRNSSYNRLTTLNASGCSTLKTLDCSENKLTNLNVSGCTELIELNCSNSRLTALDVSGCTALKRLYCNENQVTNLDVSGCTELTTLDCSQNQLTILDVSNCTALTELGCSSNQLTSLDVSGCASLTMLICNSNQLTALDVSGCTALTELDCRFNQLTALDVSGCTALTELNCSHNQLTTLDVSGCTALTGLLCGGNQLSALDVSGCNELTELKCIDNKLTSLNVSGYTKLETLNCNNNKLTALDVSGCTALTSLDCRSNQLTALNASGCTALTSLDCSENQLTALDVSGCTALTTLTCKYNQLTTLDVSGCTELPRLDCSGNQLTKLDVSGCTALTSLDCISNQLTTLDVSDCTKLRKLWCDYNKLTSLNVSGCTALTELSCGSNEAPLILNASGCTALRELDCNWNQLTSLNVSGCTALNRLYCNDNQLTALNVSGCTSLTLLHCSGNQLTSLDVSGCTELLFLNCSKNQIEADEMTILIKSLPNRQGILGELCISEAFGEGNVCYRYHVTLAKAKNWNCSYKSGRKFNGISNPIYAIKQTAEGEGSLKLIGADNLNAVEYGTELTIVATPAEGYELTALTANGTDILATKKVLVKEATEVRAIFVKKTFTVTLTKEAGEGKLAATGAADLTAVPFGTELTIEATSAAGYELKTLTANGADILATRKVVVKEATEVKAIFVKKTFTVTLTKEAGKGTLNATGADNLNAVGYGTELTIEATPAEGYELKALTANGTDILTTKKFVVKEATEVKATFAKKTFTVTLTKEGEGTLNATGADNLNAVEYGTELTIDATPAEGYTLVSLTANGADILATRKVVVKETTEVKATFAKKTFAVKLTKEGEGTLNATGADNLNAVEYGTELTIEATPAAGYELKALTANGADILATKKVVVKGATEIKATFTKKTAADSVEAGSVHLYPSPASTYVNVKAAKADALVRLYDANGTLLYEARTDDHGMLQIELSAYAEGTYLLLVDGNAQRLLIQR